MKQIIVIGDIHGRNTWKEIVAKHPNAHFVFVGDYFDSFDISVIIQMHNFNEIVAFKKENPDNVTLLLGNHDYHYLPNSGARYNGFEYATYAQMSLVIDELIRNQTIQICFLYDKYLISHAGLTNTWCNNRGILLDDLVNDINMLLVRNYSPFGFSGGNPEGDSITQGPLWVRPKSLRNDKLGNYHQIVGHTRHNEINIDRAYNLTFIDALGSGKYLMIENNELIPMQL